MKTIIGLTILMLTVFTTKAQSIHEMLVGSWKVTSYTSNPSPVQKEDKSGPKDNMPNAIPVGPHCDPSSYPENDMWKFTRDSLYYFSNYLKYTQALHCTYTVKDSTIYCYGQPAYTISNLTGSTVQIKKYVGADNDAGLYTFPNASIVLYLKKYK